MNSTYPSTIWDKSSASYARALVNNSVSGSILIRMVSLLAIGVIVGGTPEEKVKWACKLYDVDGNGIIDPSETFEVGKAILPIVSPDSKDVRRRARNLFKTIDENVDGVLTQSEFVRCCIKNNKITRLIVPVEI